MRDGAVVEQLELVQGQDEGQGQSARVRHRIVRRPQLTGTRGWARWLRRLAGSAGSAAVEVFVPRGYPKSVSAGYAQFQVFDSIQGLCSYLRGVLSTQAVLSGLGVGEGSASTLAATTQWMYRDGAGMLGGLLFASYGAGRFDADVKGWRLFADASVDVALTLELTSPLLCAGDATCFTAVVCTANVLKAMCGVAAGATRAVITAHFAKDGNVADVQAKEGSQETAVNLVGMLLGLQLAWHVDARSDVAWLPWAAFALLTVVHLAANLLAVRALRLPHLNAARLSILLGESEEHGPVADLSVATANRLEGVLLPLLVPPALLSGDRFAFQLGCRPEEARHFADLCFQPCVVIGRRHNVFRVAMRDDARPADVVSLLALQVLGPDNAFLDRVEAEQWSLAKLHLPDSRFRVSVRPATATANKKRS